MRWVSARLPPALAAWLDQHPGVVAKRTSWMALEQWEGTAAGRSFYFGERHGSWRIELDLRPNGRFANRVVGADSDGGFVTEPVELTEGDVIAESADSALGRTPVEHLAFIVRTIGDHIAGEICTQEGTSCSARCAVGVVALD